MLDRAFHRPGIEVGGLRSPVRDTDLAITAKALAPSKVRFSSPYPEALETNRSSIDSITNKYSTR
jgi:hypothetical protein